MKQIVYEWLKHHGRVEAKLLAQVLRAQIEDVYEALVALEAERRVVLTCSYAGESRRVCEWYAR